MVHLRLVPQAMGQEEELRIFTVEWDARQLKFVALDDNRMPLGASSNQSNAISRAIRDAKKWPAVTVYVSPSKSSSRMEDCGTNISRTRPQDAERLARNDAA